jgi:isopenicillin-N epimerase
VVARLRAAVGPRTRLICLSHITSATALILPVSEVCAMARAQGVLTLIDGAHAPGQIDLNLQSVGADFYVGNCHKWLCAPKGAAFLYARGEHQAMLDAPVISWGYAPHAAEDLSAQAFLGKTPFERRMQWQGTRDVSAWLSVPEALRFLAEHDWPSVRARCHALAEEALEALTRRHGLQPISGPQHWAQMVAIPVPPQNAPALQQRLLNESGIEVPVTTHGDQVFVRVSVQAYNSPEDIEALLNAPALR